MNCCPSKGAWKYEAFFFLGLVHPVITNIRVPQDTVSALFCQDWYFWLSVRMALKWGKNYGQSVYLLWKTSIGIVFWGIVNWCIQDDIPCFAFKILFIYLFVYLFYSWVYLLSGCGCHYKCIIVRDQRAELLAKWRTKGGVFLIGYTAFRNLSLGKRVKDHQTAREICSALQVIIICYRAFTLFLGVRAFCVPSCCGIMFSVCRSYEAWAIGVKSRTTVNLRVWASLGV